MEQLVKVAPYWGSHLQLHLADGEKMGIRFGDSVLNAKSLAELRALPAEQILQATSKAGFGRFPVVVDGYFFPKQPLKFTRLVSRLKYHF